MKNILKDTAKLHSERYLLPKHLGISSRKVTYWKERIILPFFTKDKHAKMNISEAVWLFVINELTTLGIDSERLAALAKDVWHNPIKEGYLDKKLDKLISMGPDKYYKILSEKTQKWMDNITSNTLSINNNIENRRITVW